MSTTLKVMGYSALACVAAQLLYLAGFSALYVLSMVLS